MKRISRRSFMTGGATLLGASILSACTPAAQGPSAAQPTANTSDQSAPKDAPAPASNGSPVPALLRSGSGEEDFFNKAIDLFEKKNPAVKVNRIFVPGGADYNTKLDLMVAAGDPPAIYAPFSDRGYRYYADKGLSQPLDEFVKRDQVDLSDFHPDGMKGCMWDGKLSALPLDLWPHVLFYNKTLFKAAGIPNLTTDWNDASWTTDKYLELAKALTKREGDTVTQFGSDVYFNYWAAGWIFGGDFLPPETYETGRVKEFAGDTDPRVAPAVQWAADLILKEKVAPSPAQAQ